ncbi:MAG: 50S ribosomal protein L30 [Chloroflexi bacterium]|nr:50S ribosomal protein L30 [Chloroflexota bacterium]MBT4073265.1 50S ribosomal protein L30 [Chloroflexota bacterium]MBT4516189.1 50S ribosomal protein L30 [Chloroflexota bacterium]MBT6682025.1 50S ribosomal protein L30 [Chloroflexota bacterium]
MADLRITQIKSKIGYPQDQRATLQSLGLRKIRQQVVRPDNPAVRGMIQKVRHLVTVEEAE